MSECDSGDQKAQSVGIETVIRGPQVRTPRRLYSFSSYDIKGKCGIPGPSFAFFPQI